ncbi:uncharacterized protein [Pyrus communis]|uniref:uncharacterized protein n=1 Tax=Pyrus communis TaxID=23211 RepID=UPI0035C05157
MYGLNSIQINTILDYHTCGRTWANKNMTASLLTDLYLDWIKLNPTWPVKSFLFTMESQWNHGCRKMKAYRALNKAFKIIEGKYAEQYTKLWDFAEEVKMTNPGSIVKFKLDVERFKRIYGCLGACKESFKVGCIPLISLDGCHLKVLPRGQLLCVVGIDPNDETWVIAYAVVEMENKVAWIWFLQLLVDDVGIENQNGWTFISDMQKRLIPAFQKVVAKRTTVPYFKKAMEEVKKLDNEAYKWLVKKPATQWSKSHFEIYPNHIIAKTKAYYNYAANDLYYVDEENSNEARYNDEASRRSLP